MARQSSALLTETQVGRVLGLLVSMDILIVSMYAADAAGNIFPYPYKRFVDIDAELSLAAWFSSMQLFVLGVVFGLISRSGVENGVRRMTLILAIAAVFLSLDEMTAIHEQLSVSLRDIDRMPGFKGGHGKWIFIYGIVALGLAAWFFRDLVDMSKAYPKSSRMIVVGALVAGAGAVGVEIAGYEWLRSERDSGLYRASLVLEELMELIGCSVALYGALLLLSARIEFGVRPR